MNGDSNPYQPVENVDGAAGQTPDQTKQSGADKVPFSAHLLCGWPFLMVAFGGAIGGGLGGGAYGINMAIYKSNLPIAAKVALNVLTGIAAFAIWFAIVLAIHAAKS
ncbi:hypothetical protein Mal15_20150 [Stieleria maiorica]|uniref:Uncharacterized protein n=1 Tax=Stieleria maiorica TaxID=2795974 RepID=A0A5B9MBP5_9BACT|nr:hypothetical protein Mal15_20150 [Stieleria maiorica]